MTQVKRFFSAVIRTAAMVCALSVSHSWAASTSLELYGVLFDGDGNRINAPSVLATSAIYDSATGGSLLAQFGTEGVHVGNGGFLQIFSVDDSLFAGDAYLQLNLNGFEMEPRLGIFYNGSYYFASGVTAGPAGDSVFQLYAGLAAPVPEPGTYAMLAAGLGVMGLFFRRRQP